MLYSYLDLLKEHFLITDKKVVILIFDKCKQMQLWGAGWSLPGGSKTSLRKVKGINNYHQQFKSDIWKRNAMTLISREWYSLGTLADTYVECHFVASLS